MALGFDSKKALQYGIDSQTDFYLGNLTGHRVHGKIELGRMPKSHAKGIERAVYVVYSCGTPIAWALDDKTWFIPRVDFSVTTSHHQAMVRVAVDNPGYYS